MTGLGSGPFAQQERRAELFEDHRPHLGAYYRASTVPPRADRSRSGRPATRCAIGRHVGQRDIIVIGASAGGVEAVGSLVAELPDDLPASVFVVVHVPAYGQSMLPSILSRRSRLQAVHATDGDEFHNGLIYVAPPDHHMLLDRDRIRVRHGPKENRFRPSVDALFRSAAYVHGPRVIGVVMSGILDDGTSGLWSIKRLGGITMAQTPQDALHAEMPRSAIEQVVVDHTGTAKELGMLIGKLAGTEVPAKQPVVDREVRRLGVEIDIAARGGAFDKGILQWGDIAPFTCPDCHGALVRFQEGPLLRFRCNTGHAFTPRALLASISEALETTFGQASRGLEEQTLMFDLLASHFEKLGETTTAERFRAKGREIRAQARIIEETLPRLRRLSEEVELP